jgi:transglutaminase-like putative cysteine protease
MGRRRTAFALAVGIALTSAACEPDTEPTEYPAIQQHFQGNGFNYSNDVEPIQGQDALVEFLTSSKAGFCQHYTSAMAVLVRALGLPARIAVGFRTGTRQEDGSYVVRTADAHVWVEVLFPRYGWLPFEPEAGTVLPDAHPGTYLDPVAPAAVS